jgi:hypothetical protein
MTDLGIRYYSNCNYWLQSTTPGDYLFRHDPAVSHDDCDIVIVSYTWPYWVRMKTFDLRRQPLPAGLFKKGRKYFTVYMDNFDGHRTISWEPEYRQFDAILRSKLNSRICQPDNMRPWAYGLTNRIMRATDGALEFAARKRTLLANYGASHPFPHQSRNLSRAEFEPAIELLIEIDRTRDDLSTEPADPYEALMWRQTGGRFSRQFYERLKHSQAVACFCGELIPSAPYDGAERYLVGGNRARLRRALYEAMGWFDPRPRRAIGWDSFRFWEALSAGCASFNIDLNFYGVDLPAMPTSGVDYLGVKFSKTGDLIKQLSDDPSILKRVAAAGKRWAHLHYSPKAVAQRFLNMFASGFHH